MTKRIYKWVAFKSRSRSHLVRLLPHYELTTACGCDVTCAKESDKSKPHCFNCEAILETLQENPDLEIKIG